MFKFIDPCIQQQPLISLFLQLTLYIELLPFVIPDLLLLFLTFDLQLQRLINLPLESVLEVPPHRDRYLRLLAQLVVVTLHDREQLFIKDGLFLKVFDRIRLLEVDLLKPKDMPF